MAKFLKDTHGKSLAKAGKSKSFAIRMSISHKKHFLHSSMDCNIDTDTDTDNSLF